MSETNTLAATAAEPIAAANRKRALEHLARFRDRPLGHFIDGTPTDGAGGKPFDVLVPSTGEVIGQALAGTAADIDAAAAAAKRAFPTWSQTSGDERRDSCTPSLTRSWRAPRRSRCVEIARYRPADPLHDARPRCAARRTSASSPTARPGAGDGLVAADDAIISITRCASRSGRSASSRRGTRRSCCRRGRSRRRSRPAAPSCTSRRNGARSQRTCS